MQFVATIEEHRTKTLAELATVLHSLPKVRVGSLTFEQVCKLPTSPHGLYAVFSPVDGSPWYIGVAQGRSFGPRLAAQLDQQQAGAHNAIPRKILAHRLASTYRGALDVALDLQLSMLSVPTNVPLGRLQNALRSLLRPLLNPRYGYVDPAEPVAKFLIGRAFLEELPARPPD